MNTVENRIVDPAQWDEIGPLLDGGILRPYGELRRMPYYAPPGFYADDSVIAFQPGWDGQEGSDPVHWYAPDWPTVAEVREKIASLLVSSWLVQDRDDAGGFFLGDEPGSVETPWGTVPARVIFAPRKGNDMPWENLASVLDDVDHANANAGFIAWRLRNALHPRVKTKFHLNPDGALVVVFHIKGDEDDIPVFLWNKDGSPRSGQVQEYERSAYCYEIYPLPTEADLENFLAQVAE